MKKVENGAEKVISVKTASNGAENLYLDGEIEKSVKAGKRYYAMTLTGYKSMRCSNKEFDTAVAAYKYLKKKVSRFSGRTHWNIAIEFYNGAKFETIYEKGVEIEERTTDAEIQALIEAENFETEVNIKASEAKHFYEDIFGNYGHIITKEDLFNFLVYYYEKFGIYFENAGGASALKELAFWVESRQIEVATQAENEKAEEEILAEYVVSEDAQTIAVISEENNAFEELKKEVEIKECLRDIEKAVAYAAEKSKEIEKVNVYLAKSQARSDCSAVLTEYAQKLLGTFHKYLIPQEKFDKEEYLDCEIELESTAVWATIFDNISGGGIRIAAINSGTRYIKLAEYESYKQFSAALNELKNRLEESKKYEHNAAKGYGLYIHMPEVEEVEIDNGYDAEEEAAKLEIYKQFSAVLGELKNRLEESKEDTKFEVGEIYQAGYDFGGYYKVIERRTADDGQTLITLEDVKHNQVTTTISGDIIHPSVEYVNVRICRNRNDEYVFNDDCLSSTTIYASKKVSADDATKDMALSDFLTGYKNNVA